MPSTTTIVVLLAGFALAYAWYCRKKLRLIWRKGEKFAAEFKPYAHDDSLRRLRIVVVGDEVAVGVGGTKEESLAARISEYLHASVENYGMLGAATGEVSDQMAKAWRAHYDLACIFVGANDILAFRWGALSGAARALDAVLPRLEGKMERVLVCTGADLGRMPAYWWPMSWFLSYRSRLLRKRFRSVCAKHGAEYVDIIAAPRFSGLDNQKYYTQDKVHFTGAAYEHWFGTIKNALARWPKLMPHLPHPELQSNGQVVLIKDNI